METLEDRRLLSAASPTIELFSTSPALFVENQGQWADASVRYLHQGDGVNVAMTPAGPVLHLFQQETGDCPDFREAQRSENGTVPFGPAETSPIQGRCSTADATTEDDYHRGHGGHREGFEATPLRTAQVSIHFDGAHTVEPVGLDEAETVFNYYVGEESNWRTAVPTFEAVAYRELYDGIDLLTWGQRDSLKYEFHVAPGVDYRQIEIRYEGIDGLSLDAAGALHVETELGELIDDTPFIYQQINDQQVEVAGRFQLLDDNGYTFNVTGDYSANHTLVIDPDVSWATYLGGSSLDYGEGIAVDASGNALVAGHTYSTDFAGTTNTHHGGTRDAFVAKVAFNGSLEWATYLGGGGDDRGYGIAVDASGSALVTGVTDSIDFAGTTNTYHGDGDPFVAKVASNGSLTWATYLGGVSADIGLGIAVDASGNALVTGYTSSTDFVGRTNTHHGYYDAFVAKVSPSGSLVWATYLGGSGWDEGRGIAVDASGNALVTGTTYSTDFAGKTNTNHGGDDAFVAKVASNGSLAWATYLGGGTTEWGLGIAVDASGNALVAGWTDSIDFAGTTNTYHGDGDPFVAKVFSSGSLEWATYLGGSNVDWGWGIAVDASGNALVTGDTGSIDFAGKTNTYHHGGDAFVAKVSFNGSLVWATYLGGSDHDYGQGIAVDASGNALVTGWTGSTDFAGKINTHHGSYNDAFVAKVRGVSSPFEVSPFEILARGVAYPSAWHATWQELDPPQQVWFDGEDLGYTVERVFQDGTGFYSLGLQSEHHGPALVIRGTEPADLLDWWDDSHPQGVGWGQFDANWSEVSNWLSGLLEPVDIVGHSLGGALAQWIAAYFTSAGGLIDELVTFNSPGISSTGAARFISTRANSVTHYVVNGDLVSMAGEAFVPGDVWMASFSDWNPINKHNLPLLVPNVGDSHRPPDIELQEYSDAALSSAMYSHTDIQYRLWLAGLGVGLRSLAISQPWFSLLVPVPAMLMYRGTTEASRHLIGQALRAAEALFHWTVDASERFVLELGERAHDLYELTQITVDPSFSLSVDGGNPPALRFDGGLGVDLGNAIDIDLPSWLGGSFSADHLLELADIDTNGVMDRDGLEVNGQLNLLGGVMTVDGTATLDWDQGELHVGGTIDVLDGFVTANGSFDVGASLDLAIRGGAAVSVPNDVSWIGGTQIVGGQFLLNFVTDWTSANDFVAGWGDVAGIELGLRVWFDGSWDILGAAEIAALAPAPAPISDEDDDAQPPAPAPPEAYAESYTMPPTTDWTLLVAEWENASSSVALQLQTPAGQVLDEADIAADPNMSIVAELSDDHRRAVHVDNPNAGTWEVAVVDATGLGAVDLAAMVHDSIPSVSVVSVSDGLFREPVQIQLEAYDADSEATVALFRDTDAVGFDGVMIADGLPEADGPIDYTWDTTGVAADEYFVYARILDENNPPVFAYADAPLLITDPGWVTGRHLFYNDSALDGDDAAANEQDDLTIAVDKVALLPGQQASWANYSNYAAGINGIMFDVATHGTIALADIELRIGKHADPASWTVAPAPAEFDVRAGAGELGSQRVTLTWDDGAIANTWLQVAVRANETNRLHADDVFYFGNAIGEVGNDPGNALVTAADVIAVRDHFRGAGNRAGIDDPFDFNRDRLVDAVDVLIARNHVTSPFTALPLITAPPIVAPPSSEAEGEDDSANPTHGRDACATPYAEHTGGQAARATPYAASRIPHPAPRRVGPVMARVATPLPFALHSNRHNAHALPIAPAIQNTEFNGEILDALFGERPLGTARK